jgi:phosphoglycolate phosphatase
VSETRPAAPAGTDGRLQALIFDFDGTLSRLTIDFALLHRKIAALAEPFLGEAPEISPLPALEWLDELANEIREFDEGLSREFHTRGRLVVQATELDAAREARLFPFTREMLAGLRTEGIRTGILTRNSTAAVKTVFPDVTRCCDAFMAREDSPRVKPDPGATLTLLERLGVAPERALLVGDHPLDIRTARNAGTLAAAVTSGMSSREVLAETAPDYLAEDCRELLSQLRASGVLP